MKIKIYSPDKLRTGNTNLDNRIGFLLGLVEGKIKQFLDHNGNISCLKIDYKIDDTLKDFSPDTQKLAKHTLTKVRKKLALHFVIYKKLQQCDTLTECETLLDSYKTTPSLNSYILYHLISRTKNLPESIRIIEKYGRNVAIDSFTLNALLHKCNSTLDCEHIISQYGKHIALNSISFNYILKAILKDPHSDEQKLNIQTVFDQLQKIGFLRPKDEEVLINIIKYNASPQLKQWMKYTINTHIPKLTKLYFLLPIFSDH